MKAIEYKTIAKYYDHIMSHVDYKFWAHYIFDIINKYFSQNKINNILEIACGTGEFSIFFQKLLNKKIIISDKSLEMLKIAKNKKNITNKIVCCDMQYLPFKQKFDLILALYDSVNYILSEDDFINFLKQIKKILSHDGIFIFDITTIKNSKKYFYNEVYTESFDNFFYDRHSFFDENELIQYNKFKFYFDEYTAEETHKQKIFYHRNIKKFIKKANLKLIDALGDFKFIKGNNNSYRVHYIIKNYD